MNTEETMKPTVILLQAKQHVNELCIVIPFTLRPASQNRSILLLKKIGHDKISFGRKHCYHRHIPTIEALRTPCFGRNVLFVYLCYHFIPRKTAFKKKSRPEIAF